MEGSFNVSVILYKREKPLDVSLQNHLTDLTAEEVIFTVAKYLNFRPISLQLFALRKIQKNSNVWLPLNYKFVSSKSYQVEFRLRFKLPMLTSLSRLDENAFDYLFHQIRHDLLKGKIPELCQDEFKPQVLGLCATDMIRVIVEDGRNREEVLKNYRDFIPKAIYKQHLFFLKKKLHDHIHTRLEPTQNISSNYIKEQYVSHVEDISPTYLTEEFSAMMLKDTEYPTTIRVDPLNKLAPGLSMTYVGKQNWESLCGIQELISISIREDCTVQISRKNGIPIYLQFKSSESALSFISLLDGYYRLTEKWNFNLCEEIFTPSLQKLRALKCHGPIDLKFSYQKLSTHPSTKKGWFILRQSSLSLEDYVIDYIAENKNHPQTLEVKIQENNKLKVDEEPEEFNTIGELIFHYIKNPAPNFLIQECLPPSEFGKLFHYDRSPLLLCRSSDDVDDTLKLNTKSDACNFAPQVITPRALQIYRGKKFEFEGKFCKVIKGTWKQSSISTVNVAIKFLKKEHEDKHVQDLLEVATQCVLWQCDSLVGLKGVVLGNPHALVLEWMPYGPLDQYLQDHFLHVKTPELIEAASDIAKAVWFLEDHGIVHGNIRCRNVFVFEHNSNGLHVKLSDPSVSAYSSQDIHWIPPEFFEIPGLSKKFVTADVWAMGTTFWEVFSYGKKPPNDFTESAYKAKYLSGWRLPRPEKCPTTILRIISECWYPVPDTRKHPQAIVRDINQILYQLIGSKRDHSYAVVSSAPSETGSSSKNTSGFSALDISDKFNWTSFGSDPFHTGNSSGGTISTFIKDVSDHSGSHHSRDTQATWLDANGSPSPDLISGFTDYTNRSIGTIYSISSAVGIYEFRSNQVTIARLIGQGFYGAVYLGEIVRTDGSKEHIAVKKLKERRDSLDTAALDFRRELEILQNLCHPNIVEVKGVVYDPDLLLIMEYLPMGSLLDYFKMSYGQRPNSQQLLKFAKDVAEGMDYLSNNNIVHRDLAARNLLVANDDLIKISDFGLARVTDNDRCYTLRTRRHFPIKWYPPESLECGRFSEQSDIWSYGITLYEIFSYGADPVLPDLVSTEFGESETEMVNLEEMLELLRKGVRLPCPESCPQSVYSLLMLPCWEIQPNKRPNFRSLLGSIQRVESSLL